MIWHYLIGALALSAFVICLSFAAIAQWSRKKSFSEGFEKGYDQGFDKGLAWWVDAEKGIETTKEELRRANG